MCTDFSLLNSIRSPEDVKKLSLYELVDLAREIRHKIIITLSKQGGHLSSNLGTVDLIIALHYVFNSPDDKMIFDVGHQSYAHKLLTGRNNDLFNNLRSSKGLSGFTNPSESPHDWFYSGHAGNTLSLALGMARNDFLEPRSHHIIPIIGDASLSCGLTLEALNNLSKDLSKFIIILNDNEMSISKNVGSISQILSKLLNSPISTKLSDKLEQLIKKIPLYGESLVKSSKNVSSSFKYLFSNAPFFTQFGLAYIGPVNGHDIKKLITLFTAIKECPFSIILHIKTTKGKGLDKAQGDPSRYHGVSSLPNLVTYDLPSSSSETFPKIFGKHLCRLGKIHNNLTVVTPAMCLGSSLTEFSETYPERFFDVGIAEGHAVTFSGGLAKTGKLKVVCCIYSTFLLRAFDNIFHDVCLQNIPVIFCIDRAGLAFADGQSHHGIYDIGFLRSLPDIIICQPRNGQVLKELLSEALHWNLPSVIRYPNSTTIEETLPLEKRPIGKAEILSQGKDILVIALGHMIETAFVLKTMLENINISITIVDPIFIKPLDKDLLSRLFRTHSKIIILEEHAVKGGLGAEVNEFLVTHNFMHLSVLHIGIPDVFVNHGEKNRVLNLLGLSSEKIFDKILSYFSLSTHQKVYT